MNAAQWSIMSEAERGKVRDLTELSPQLCGLEGWRVEVITNYGETRRFIVGKSTGWIPCHLEVCNRRSHGGMAASKCYKSVQKLYKVR